MCSPTLQNVSFPQITIKLGHFTNLKAFFPGVDGFSLTCPYQKLKKKTVEKSIHRGMCMKGLVYDLPHE